MKFLFRSSDALCLPQALRVKSEGNQVKLSVQRPGFDKTGDGLIDKVMNFASAADWADIVVYDVQDGPLGEEADALRAKGKPTIGASALGQQIEHDRKIGIEFARASGVKCPEVEEFSGGAAFAKARDYLSTQSRNIDWVLKINGKAPEGVGTFVSKDGRVGATRMLRHWEEMYRKAGIKADFIITKKIDGCEISTEAWFNGHDFVLPNHTIERNKFFPGDLGEKVGCSGNVVWLTEREAPLIQRLLVPLIGQLAGKFVGPIDVNVIIEDKTNEPVFLEYSPRFGYDAVFALMELFESDFGEFLWSVARGQPWRGKMREGFAGDVRVCVPPFPAKGSADGTSDEAIGVPIFGLAKTYDPHVHLVEVMIDRDDQYVTSGPHGYVLSVTDRGESPREAEDAAYARLKAIHIPNMRYRNDLSDAIEEEYSRIEATGWLTAPTNAPKAVSLFAAMGRPRVGRRL